MIAGVRIRFYWSFHHFCVILLAGTSQHFFDNGNITLTKIRFSELVHHRGVVPGGGDDKRVDGGDWGIHRQCKDGGNRQDGRSGKGHGDQGLLKPEGQSRRCTVQNDKILEDFTDLMSMCQNSTISCVDAAAMALEPLLS